MNHKLLLTLFVCLALTSIASAVTIKPAVCGQAVTVLFDEHNLVPRTHYVVYADEQRLTGFSTVSSNYSKIHESTLPAGKYSVLRFVTNESTIVHPYIFEVTNAQCGFWTGSHHAPAAAIVKPAAVSILPTRPQKKDWYISILE